MGQPTQRATNYTARSNIEPAQIFLHSQARILANEISVAGGGAGDEPPLVFGLLPPSETYARRAFEAIRNAAQV